MEYNTENQNQEEINLRDLLYKYIKRWYWFFLSVVIALILALIYVKATPPKYNVQSKIILRSDDNNSGSSELTALSSLGLINTSKNMDDEIQILDSHNIIGQAIDSLNLQIAYFKRDGLKYVEMYKKNPLKLVLPPNLIDTLKKKIEINITAKGEIYNVKLRIGDDFKKTYKLNDIQQPFETPVGKIWFQTSQVIDGSSKYRIYVYPFQNLVESYSNKLNASAANKMSVNVINISMVASNVTKAKDLLNEIVKLYNLDAIEDKNLIALNTQRFLTDRLALITKELYNVETDVEQYKKSNRITDINSEAELYLQSSSEYNKQITDLSTQLQLMQYIEGYIKNDKNIYNLIPSNIGIQDDGLSNAIQDYNQVVLKRLEISKTSSENNPSVQALTEQIKALRSNIISSVNSIKQGLIISKNAISSKEADFNSRIRAVPTQERQFLEIKRQQEIKQNLYLFLMQKREENALTLASTAPAARTIDEAYASLEPVSPKKLMVLLVAFILGLLVPFLYIYIKDLINNKITDVKEFQKGVNAPYLGSICVSRTADDRVVVKEGKVTPIVEMFRLIRTNLQFMVASKKSPVILVTSSISGEGKSFISINLSMSFALMKKKVVLVGMDIRNPMLVDYMHISNKNGLTLYLSDDSYTVDEVITPSNINNYLDVVPAGPVPPNPSELLMTPRLDELMKELKERYDYIIVDSAPIGIVSDTYLLNKFVDNSIFVARQNYTSQDSIKLINDIYNEKRLNDMGVVLNGTPATSNYGYGYGYGHKTNKRKLMPKLSFGEKLEDFVQKLFEKKK